MTRRRQLPPFEAAQKKLGRAIEIYNELKPLKDEYCAKVEIRYETNGPDEGGFYDHLRYAFPDPPDRIDTLLADGLHNIRASLDTLVTDLAKMKGKNERHFMFPFAKDAQELEDLLSGRGKRKSFYPLGDDFLILIRKIAPHKDGNKILRALHDIDIIAKHHSIIELQISTTSKLSQSGVNLLGLSIINDAYQNHKFDASNLHSLKIPKMEIRQWVDQKSRSICHDPNKYSGDLFDSEYKEFGFHFKDNTLLPGYNALTFYINAIYQADAVKSMFKTTFT